jgi:hypothetical protein
MYFNDFPAYRVWKIGCENGTPSDNLVSGTSFLTAFFRVFGAVFSGGVWRNAFFMLFLTLAGGFWFYSTARPIFY